MSRAEKTLVILIPGFPENEADTVCLPMQQQFIRTLNEIYPRLNIIILSFQYPYFKKRYKWFDISVTSFDGRNKGGLSGLLLRRKLYSTLKEINSTNKITGLLSFWCSECALVGKRFADKYGLRHYCWIMGQDAKKENKYPGLINPNPDELIALSDFLQDEFERNHTMRPLHVIPPGIAINTLRSTEIKRDIDIIGAGSLIRLKQYDVFIEIIAEIKKSIPSVKAVLIGDGPEKSRLQNLIASSGLRSNIMLTGELPHPDVLDWMQKGKVFLHPSSYEGFGIVCIEALCSGCEAISFVKPMNRDIENWNIAINKEEMMQKTIRILQNSGTEYKSVVPYTIEQTIQKMSQLFSL